MHQYARQKTRRLLVGLNALLLCGACSLNAQAQDPRYYGYGFADSFHYPGYGHGLRQDMDRLREQMHRQQRQLEEQVRMQQEQTRLLRQQLSAQQQVTAMQACYYRFNAGLDLCEDLFNAASVELAACREKVAERNPGCAGEITRPASSTAD
jgi:hypothetical protein